MGRKPKLWVRVPPIPQSRMKVVDSKKRILYHITTKDWPDRIRLSPRIEGEFRDEREPLVARICVSETISGCMVAVYPCLDLSRSVKIYRTFGRVRGYIPQNVCDSKITKEKWLLSSVDMVKVGIINKRVVPKDLEDLVVGHRDKEYLADQLDYYKMLLRLERNGKLVIMSR